MDEKNWKLAVDAIGNPAESGANGTFFARFDKLYKHYGHNFGRVEGGFAEVTKKADEHPSFLDIYRLEGYWHSLRHLVGIVHGYKPAESDDICVTVIEGWRNIDTKLNDFEKETKAN